MDSNDTIPQISLAELASRLGGQLEGPGDVQITGITGLEEATANDVSFLANIRYQSQMATSEAAAVFVAVDYAGPVPPSGGLIRCKDPYFAFRNAMVLFFGFRKHPFTGISEQASVDPTAQVGQNVAVAPFATICRDAIVGDGCVIYPGAFVGPGCVLGTDCLIYPNAVLYDGSKLGDRVQVHAAAAIGVDGFGYATHPTESGVVAHQKIPPVGWVELEDDVEIGSGCAIQRATMGATVIGAGTKFADLVAIGHGTKLGQHCLMVSQAGIAGSTHVGNYVAFGGQAGVVGHIRIGNQVRVGAKAGVVGDLADGVEVLGQPAIPRNEAGRVVMATKKLPELRKTVKKMEKQLAAMQKQLDELKQ
jgi:UDP-3-O-[3-hydroxymyristoyl] glucosamine N-acyltransferase